MPERPRALILAPFADECLARLRRRLDVTYESWLETKRLQDPGELGARLAADGTDVLIVEADFVFEETLEAAPKLRLVGICRNALNQIDLDAAGRHGVAVTHAPGRNTNAVAELALGAMFSLLRHLPQAHRLVSGGAWGDPSLGYASLRGREMAESTVGVIGFGQIGREVARKCVALGARVLVYDPLVPERDIAALGCVPVTLDAVAERSDIVTLHVPDTEATRRLVDAAFLGRMRRDAYLVNTSTGTAIDTDALVEALESQRIAGAALDVYDGQPLPLTSPLLAAPNLMLTPHIGGATEETIERHSRIMVSEIERFLDGQPLEHAVSVAAKTNAG